MGALPRLRFLAGLFRFGIDPRPPFVGAVAKTLNIRRKRGSDKLADE